MVVGRPWKGSAPVRGSQHLDGDGRTGSALGGTVGAEMSPTVRFARTGPGDGTRPFLAWTARPSTGQEGISSHHVGAERLVGRDPTVPRVDSPALDGQEGISSHHVGAERLVGRDPTVPRVDSPALDGQEGISSHHVGAERLVGCDPTVPRVDSAGLDGQEGISSHHVGAERFVRRIVSCQGWGVTPFLE